MSSSHHPPIAAGVGQSWVQTQVMLLPSLVTLSIQTHHVTSLRLGFLICKMGIIV